MVPIEGGAAPTRRKNNDKPNSDFNTSMCRLLTFGIWLGNKSPGEDWFEVLAYKRISNFGNKAYSHLLLTLSDSSAVCKHIFANLMSK